MKTVNGTIGGNYMVKSKNILSIIAFMAFILIIIMLIN